MSESLEGSSVAKNIFVGYFVLILHVVLLVLLGVFIVFFRGLIVYMPWILGGGLLLLAGTGYWAYRHLKKRKQTLRQTFTNHTPQDRAMEISVLGGLASFRLGAANGGNAGFEAAAPLQLESPETSRLRSLERLLQMYEKGLITQEEFALLKQDVLHECGKAQPATDNDGGEVIDVDFTSHS